MQALKHGAKHKQLFLVALCDFGCRHSGRVAACQHQEQVGVETAAHALAHVLDVHQQMVQVEADIEQRADSVLRARLIDVRDAARQVVNVPALHARRHLQRGLGLVVDRVGFAQLLVLELLDVAKRLHARGAAVDVAAHLVPPGAQCREPVVAALAQRAVVACVVAWLEVDRPERLVLRVAHPWVAVYARLDRVDHRHPGLKCAAVVQALDGVAAVLVPELADQLAHGLFELAVDRVDAPAIVGGDRELAHRAVVVVEHGVEIIEHDRAGRAERTQLLIDRMQRQVGVAACEDVEHARLHVGEPVLDRAVVHQLRVCQGQPEPRSRG